MNLKNAKQQAFFSPKNIALTLALLKKIAEHFPEKEVGEGIEEVRQFLLRGAKEKQEESNIEYFLSYETFWQDVRGKANRLLYAMMRSFIPWINIEEILEIKQNGGYEEKRVAVLHQKARALQSKKILVKMLQKRFLLKEEDWKVSSPDFSWVKIF